MTAGPWHVDNARSASHAPVPLAHLYAALREEEQHDIAIRYEYGAEANFVGRLHTLRRAADAYFSKRPSQVQEGEIFSLLKEIEGWSARRNDVAHGLVRLLDVIRDPQKTLLTASQE